MGKVHQFNNPEHGVHPQSNDSIEPAEQNAV
jgi:hypothetical protein